MTEEDLRLRILAECERLGLWVFHVPKPARAGIRGRARGWPDLVIGGRGGVIFREIKSATGETSAHQDQWGWLMTSAGLSWGIWRPAGWRAGDIQSELLALAA